MNIKIIFNIVIIKFKLNIYIIVNKLIIIRLDIIFNVIINFMITINEYNLYLKTYI